MCLPLDFYCEVCSLSLSFPVFSTCVPGAFFVVMIILVNKNRMQLIKDLIRHQTK